MFAHESQLSSAISSSACVAPSNIPPGSLISLLQRGLQYTEAELAISDVFSLILYNYNI